MEYSGLVSGGVVNSRRTRVTGISAPQEFLPWASDGLVQFHRFMVCVFNGRGTRLYSLALTRYKPWVLEATLFLPRQFPRGTLTYTLIFGKLRRRRYPCESSSLPTIAHL